MFKEFTELPAAELHRKLRMCVEDRFSMTPEEIAIAIGFYEKRNVPVTEIAVARVRTVADSVSKPITIFTFLNYSYDNGHHGVYPLDTNIAGVLREDCGTYKVGLAE